jgi:lipopolysaccharide export system permease protein
MKNRLNLLRIDKYIIGSSWTYIFMITLIISISVVFDINEKIDKFMTTVLPERDHL